MVGREAVRKTKEEEKEGPRPRLYASLLSVDGESNLRKSERTQTHTDCLYSTTSSSHFVPSSFYGSSSLGA